MLSGIDASNDGLENIQRGQSLANEGSCCASGRALSLQDVTAGELKEIIAYLVTFLGGLGLFASIAWRIGFALEGGSHLASVLLGLMSEAKPLADG